MNPLTDLPQIFIGNSVEPRKMFLAWSKSSKLSGLTFKEKVQFMAELGFHLVLHISAGFSNSWGGGGGLQI